jgi:FMN-dependent NADH-azoreductase
MERLIVIDSCMREGSRTKRILNAAMEVLSGRYDVETVDVNALALPPVTPETLAQRSSGVVPEETVAVARRIASADRLVIAAPFWDMSFPAVLKAFFENMSLFGVTFTDNGRTCEGLCRCRRVMYITTRGMDIETGSARDQGSSYIDALSSLWGLGEVITVAAWNLDYLHGDELEKKLGDTETLARALAMTF